MMGGSRSFHRLEFNSKTRELKSERRNLAGCFSSIASASKMTTEVAALQQPSRPSNQSVRLVCLASMTTEDGPTPDTDRQSVKEKQREESRERAEQLHLLTGPCSCAIYRALLLHIYSSIRGRNGVVSYLTERPQLKKTTRSDAHRHTTGTPTMKLAKDVTTHLFKYVKVVDIRFNPFDGRSKSVKELLRQVQATRYSKANPKLEIKKAVLATADAPFALFQFVDGSEVSLAGQ